jgi:23S rRNA (guanosine2251-2'-O)-methyltransferase
MNDNIALIYGKHAVEEAIEARPDIVRAVYVLTGTDYTGVSKLISKSGMVKRAVEVKKLPKGIPTDAVHQGIVAEIDTSLLMVDYEEFIRMHTVTDDTAFALLGELQDPHNVGAIIRSATAFGVSAVLIPEHRQAQITGSVIKVSAGMVFRIPLVRIGNVNQTIEDLKARGFWTYGLEGEAKQSVSDEQFEKPSVFVLGNEGTGIRQKTLEHCDIPLRIPMHEGAESLNASVAAAVVFYAWSTHHSKK